MKLKLSFPIERVIEGNLSLQSVSRALQSEYKIYNPNVALLTSEKFIKNFNSWPKPKKDDFIKLVVGKANFKKGQSYFTNIGASYGI